MRVGLAATVAAVAVVLSPLAALAQSLPGVYIGAEGGANWLFNNNGFSMNTGWAAGGFIGYDFVGPRLQLEGVYRSNSGTGPFTSNGTPGSSTTCVPMTGGPVPTCTTVTTTTGGAAFNNYGYINQVAILLDGFYDFMPNAVITPYIGAGVGIAFVDAATSLGSTQFAYQGILGLGWNVDQNFRINLDGRYYGTTSPGAYTNNDITAMLSLSYKFGPPAPAVAPPPPPAPQAPSFMVFFDWDRSNLSAQALATIQQAANVYKTKGNARITATGHTDTSGPESYNMALSLRRANAVKDALVRDGVPATAITVIGKGETQPLVPTGDGVREPQNRRVEIVIQ